MVEHTISALAEAVGAVKIRLIDAKKTRSRKQIVLAEDDLSVEVRSLLTRYVDLVLWSGQLDKPTYEVARRAIDLAAREVDGSNSASADSIRLRLREFDDFISENRQRVAARLKSHSGDILKNQDTTVRSR